MKLLIQHNVLSRFVPQYVLMLISLTLNHDSTQLLTFVLTGKQRCCVSLCCPALLTLTLLLFHSG